MPRQEIVNLHAFAALGVRFEAAVRTHAGSRRSGEVTQTLTDGAILRTGGAELTVAVATATSAAGGVDLTLKWTVTSGTVDAAAVGITATWTRWSADDYLLIPAAGYSGNRYPRSPGIDKADPTDHHSISVSPIPRLHPDGEPAEASPFNRWNSGFPGGRSRIQLLAGDASTPMLALRHGDTGVAIITDQETRSGQNGLSIVENAARNQAVMAIMAPGVREEVLYQNRESRDTGAVLRSGDTVRQRMVVHVFPTPDIPALLARVFDLRHELAGHPRQRHDLPFATAFAMQERKHNRENWVEEEGYYSVGMRESSPQDWQTGWVGGPNSAYALLVEGDALSTQRALRCFDFIAREAVTPSGFVKGSYCSQTKAWNQGLGQ